MRRNRRKAEYMDKKNVARRRIAVLLVLILSATLLGINLSGCSAASSSLTMTVKSQTNNIPIDGATVSISGPVSAVQVTGSDGVATFSSIPSGTYQVTVTAPGYKTVVSNSIQVNGATNAFASFYYTNAYFTFNPANPPANSTVTFDASLSNSSGTILSYNWSFGDGVNGTGVRPSHVYSKNGDYTVILKVTSTVGTAQYTQVVPVGSPAKTIIYIWFLLLIPLIILIPIVLYYRRRHYYVIIQARRPEDIKPVHCPGNDTVCDDCKLTPC